MSVIDDVKTLITGIESNIYLGSIPDEPDTCVAIYQSQGLSSLNDLDKIRIRQQGVQIRVRDTSYESGYTRAENIVSAISLRSNETINNNNYLAIVQIGDILPLGVDDRNRVEFSINFQLQKY